MLSTKKAEEYKMQQAIKNAASTDNSDTELKNSILQQEQATFLRKIYQHISNM